MPVISVFFPLHLQHIKERVLYGTIAIRGTMKTNYTLCYHHCQLYSWENNKMTVCVCGGCVCVEGVCVCIHIQDSHMKNIYVYGQTFLKA